MNLDFWVNCPIKKNWKEMRNTNRNITKIHS